MAEINISDITDGSIDGNGVFDQLMKSVEAHLQQELNRGRITQPEYSQIYISGLNSTLQQAIGFVLGRQQADKQAELLVAQTEVSNAQATAANEDIYIKRAQITDDISVDPTLMTTFTGSLGAQLTNLSKQNEKLDSEIVYSDKKVEEITYNIDHVLPEQLLKLQEEVDLLQTQDLKLLADKELVTQQKDNLVEEANNIPKVGTKLDKEVDVLTAKENTEKAQTQDIAVDNSVIGKQLALYTKQTEGFDRDAEQKVLKIAMDGWNTAMAISDEPVLPDELHPFIAGSVPNGKNGINLILDRAMKGINSGDDLTTQDNVTAIDPNNGYS